MFTYLNYARYGIAKLAGLTRLSKIVCETRDKFLRYPQDMIDYYNSVAKIIYGSTEVTDVTTVGDKNGFRAQSTAKIGEIFKGLSSYQVPCDPRRAGYTSRPILTGLNIYLNGYIEDQNRMKIETCMVDSTFGKFLFTIGYIPEISFIVFVQAMKIGCGATMCANYTVNDTENMRGIGKFSQGFIFLDDVTPSSIGFRVASFRRGSTRMSTTRNAGSGMFLLSPLFTLTAQQAGFLYFQTINKDLDEKTLASESVGVTWRTNLNISHSWSEYKDESVPFVHMTGYDPSDVDALNIWDVASYIPESYELAVNDATAIALMYILSQDIMAEINAA